MSSESSNLEEEHNQFPISASIFLDKKCYLPSDTIQGFVILDILGPIYINSIDLKLIGLEKCEFPSRSSTSKNMKTYFKNPQIQTHVFLQMSLPLIYHEKDINLSLLKLGEYKFPFSFTLPSSFSPDLESGLSGSFKFHSTDSLYAWIKYKLKLFIYSKQKKDEDDNDTERGITASYHLVNISPSKPSTDDGHEDKNVKENENDNDDSHQHYHRNDSMNPKRIAENSSYLRNKPSFIFEKELLVSSGLLDPPLHEYSISKEFIVSQLKCIGKGSCFVSLTTDKNTYFPGDLIKLKIFVKNSNCSVPVRRIKCQLFQNILFHCHNDYYKKKLLLSEAGRGPIKSQCDEVHRLELEFPSDIETSTRSCLISCHYSLKVTICYSSCISDLKLPKIPLQVILPCDSNTEANTYTYGNLNATTSTNKNPTDASKSSGSLSSTSMMKLIYSTLEKDTSPTHLSATIL